jgi:hypothetical protein
MMNNWQQAKALAAGFDREEGRARYVLELNKQIAQFDVRCVTEEILNLP